MQRIVPSGLNVIRSFSSSGQNIRSKIPKEVGKEMSDLFKSGNYNCILEKIKKSPYKTELGMIELKAAAQKLLIEETSAEYQCTLKQINLLKKELPKT